MSPSSRLVVLSVLAAWMTVLASAVGPVMNQQPTIFDLIQNDPDLSEVRVITLPFHLKPIYLLRLIQLS